MQHHSIGVAAAADDVGLRRRRVSGPVPLRRGATAMRRVLKAVGRLWYDFVIGSDWTVAATVAVTVLLTWSLHVFGLAAWWLPPFYVVVALGISLRRTASRRPLC